LETKQFRMADSPGTVRAPAGAAFFGFKPTESAMLPNGELSEADQSGELIGRVPIALLLPSHESAQHRLDAFQPFIDCHDPPL
jgi:hypothetical protein